ncbi:hypothetical protein [Streptomyces ureilyticus]|uniref:Uncharacterized protein n=1 Tax=Streptomyces ureilyticus TaxID=1775131 RepID=A0ABX0DPI9_9ACTN|nr:hypothetical protein [Streptomyces ureilyticus]NGO43776.1 hypothetical protein [Streptomyces ureilyticus]
MSDPLKDFNARLDAALAPAMQGAADRVMAKRLESAAKTGGKEAAKELAKTMTPEQAARVARHLQS